MKIKKYIVTLDENSQNWFQPNFSYQMVDRSQKIHGYKNLSIDITLNGSSLFAFVDIKFSEKKENAMAFDDLLLTKHLPNGFTRDWATFQQELEKEVTPFGKCIESYNVSTTSQNGHTVCKSFQLYQYRIADHPTYHTHVEKLAPWFIEGADPIDVTNSQWTVFLLYEKLPHSYCLAGYITRFSFFNPVIRPSGQQQPETQRICQVLVLPCYQKQGHCARMVECIMKQARENKDVYQVNVEDPVPAFSTVRNLCDLRACRLHHVELKETDLTHVQEVCSTHLRDVYE